MGGLWLKRAGLLHGGLRAPGFRILGVGVWTEKGVGFRVPGLGSKVT